MFCVAGQFGLHQGPRLQEGPAARLMPTIFNVNVVSVVFEFQMKKTGEKGHLSIIIFYSPILERYDGVLAPYQSTYIQYPHIPRYYGIHMRHLALESLPGTRFAAPSRIVAALSAASLYIFD